MLPSIFYSVFVIKSISFLTPGSLWRCAVDQILLLFSAYPSLVKGNDYHGKDVPPYSQTKKEIPHVLSRNYD